MDILKVGDTVMWRGGWGRDPVQEAVVTEIEITERPREKYGTDASEVQWVTVKEDRVVVGLDNGHWAYGYQIAPRRMDVRKV
jgi:hypothetical protein